MRAFETHRDWIVPKFRAIVEGQNFLFMLDDEPQHLDFHRTVCLEAECVDSASEQAIRCVKAELYSHDHVTNKNENSFNVSLGYIEQIDVLDIPCAEHEFIWYFPDDAVFDYKLRREL